jgi:K+-sensing histidine kinase KdpD
MERKRLEDEQPKTGILVDQASVVHDSGDPARKRRDLLKRYGLALALAGLALFVRSVLPFPEGTSVYQLPLAAIVLSAWYGGRGPGLLASLISITAVGYWFVPPVNSVVIAPDHVLAFSIFIGLCLLLSEFSAGRRHDRPRELTIVSRRSDANAVVVEVRDSGPGLDPERAERVFEPFYTTKAQGIGIGLSISRSIVEAHGGRLSASANEPHGAVFRFSLPVAQEGAA